ncbi:YggS family pyridoxal phosphate-dependent enzyme [Clostridiaceae bacterium M8S5]|nr:YggS family pyridoxal phosphate-dependent enzyme [Clostridiaceae bacterium M8S5]
MELTSNLADVKARIERAAQKSGRKLEDIDLIAVTKTVDVDVIKEAVKLNLTKLGENKPQEIKRKSDILSKQDIDWHMIGHLQTNKVKYIIDKVSLIHSLDRLSLAKEIQKKANDNNLIVDVLVQVNVSGEESKFGLEPDKVVEFIKEVSKFDKIRIKGLMTMAPFYSEPEETRFVFRGLKKLSEQIEELKLDNVEMKYLSMGMTNDFEIAIEEGANMVRVGTGLFGERVYK